MTASLIERTFARDPSGLLPSVNDDNRPFWDGLAQRCLRVQVCDACDAPRLPVAPVCPACGGRAARWQDVSGRGRIFSWVRYHRSYLPEFSDLVPYVVALVELPEGPRLFARLVDLGGRAEIGSPVELVVEAWPDGRHVPAFVLAGASS